MPDLGMQPKVRDGGGRRAAGWTSEETTKKRLRISFMTMHQICLKGTAWHTIISLQLLHNWILQFDLKDLLAQIESQEDIFCSSTGWEKRQLSHKNISSEGSRIWMDLLLEKSFNFCREGPDPKRWRPGESFTKAEVRGQEQGNTGLLRWASTVKTLQELHAEAIRRNDGI